MAKVKIKSKDGIIEVRSKLDKEEYINEREMQVLSTKIIRGIMRPTAETEKKLIYISPSGIKLSEYLRRGISLNDFFLVLAQSLEVVKSVGRNSFNISNLILDTDKVFVNEYTKELHFIYQPIVSVNAVCNIANFLFDIVYSVNLGLNDDYGCVNQLANYMRGLPVVSVMAMEKYILEAYPQVYHQIKRQNFGKSEYIGNGKEFYYRENVHSQGKNQTAGGVQAPVSAPIYPTPADADDGEDTSVLGLDDEAGETTLLDASDETTVLDEAPVKTFPYMIRKSNYDKIEINKPVFRIGKERSYVDCFVANNNAVSRLHADIITKNDRYFIKDNNSTNKTYVNGMPLQPMVEVEIHEGDEIVLANEPFEFHIR